MNVLSTFGLAGCAGGVDEHVELFSVSVEAITFVRLAVDKVIPPDIAVGVPGHLTTDAAVNYHSFYGGRGVCGGIRHFFPGDGFDSTGCAIRSDEDLGAAIVQARRN